MTQLSAFLPALPTWLWAAGFGLLGLIVGSFIATLCLRWPEGRSAMAGRSQCDHCGRILGPAELLPVLSAIAFRGRCRSCGRPIARLHIVVEIAAAFIGAVPFLLVPIEMAACWALLGWLLLPLAILDWRHLWLPNPIVALLALAGIAVGPLFMPVSWSDRLVGAALGFGSLWLLGALYRAVRGREGLGAGDAKLLGALGLWFGWLMLPAVLLLASLIGILAAIAMQVTRGGVDRMTALPFGSFLAAGAWLAPFTMMLVG